MKKIKRKTILVLMTFVPLLLHGQDAFRAEMINVHGGSEKVYKLQSDGKNYRYDFEDGGMKGTVIVDREKGKTAILLPDEKFVHYTDIHSSMSLMNDPCQAFLYSKSRYDEKQTGKENIAGFDCNKSELYASDRLIFTAWYSEYLGFPVKLVNEMADDTYMELRDIEKGKISSDVFNVPEDYTEVDQKMRPVIPEQPAPESWNKTEVPIPVKGEYKRGELLSFKVPESRNYKIILNNKTDKPAKIVRIALLDGKELPDNEQGPLSYRTKRLYPGESSTNVYSWTAGDEKLIQVHEGVINIAIIPENR